MHLDLLTESTALAFAENFGINCNINVDWHPLTERTGCYYQSDVCDRFSDILRIAPASLAFTLKQQISSKLDIAVESDSRGFLFADAAGFERPDIKSPPGSTLIYIQTPRSDTWPLLYYKFMALIGVQLELLRQKNSSADIYIPNAMQGASGGMLLKADSFFEKDGFIELLNVLRSAAHPPVLEDLKGFGSFLQDRSDYDSQVLWLTPDLLSLPKIATIIYQIRRSSKSGTSLSTRMVRMESSREPVSSEMFSEYFKNYGYSLLLSLAETEHNLDFDWQIPKLENWLNTVWLIKSLEPRLKSAGSPGAVAGLSLSPDPRLRFLILNLELMAYRAAYSGDSRSLLQAVREIGQSMHVLINKGQMCDLKAINIEAGFPPEISSIILGFQRVDAVLSRLPVPADSYT